MGIMQQCFPFPHPIIRSVIRCQNQKSGLSTALPTDNCLLSTADCYSAALLTDN
jgi:hypothetical protein